MSRFSTSTSHVTLAAALARGFNFAPDDPIAAPPTSPPAPSDPTQSLRDEFGRLEKESKDVFDAATTAGRPLTKDEQTAHETRFSRMKAIKKLLDDRDEFAKVSLSEGRMQTPVQPPTADKYNGHQDAPAAGQKIDRDEFGKAVATWGGSGVMDRKFATITTASATGIYLPKEIAATIVPTNSNVFREAAKIQAMESVAVITTATNAELKVPVAIGSAGGVVAEDASAETENAPSLSESIDLKTSTYQSGSVYYSNAVLAAGAVDIVNAVVPVLVYEKELGLEAAAVAALIADAGITQVVTSATTTGFTYDNLVDLNNALPKRFQSAKVILLSATAFAAAEKMVGDDGHPVLNRDPQNQSLLRFNGTPVLRCDNLEAMTANKTIGVCISLIGFRLRDVAGQNLARYDQVPAKPNQTGFNLFGYHAYGWADSAVAKLKTAAA